jgi:ATP phosphoribosyltransferase
MFEAHRRAGEVVSITANVEGDNADAVADRLLARRDLAGSRGPTITPVYDPSCPGRVFAVTLVVPLTQLSGAKDHLRRSGGGTIVVQQPMYLFDERSTLYARLLERLEISSAPD